MPRIPVHTTETAPEASRAALEAVAKRYGRVLNIHGEMAHSRALLHAYTGINRALSEHGHFDERVRETIALTVSAVDACTYCQSAHTVAALRAGFTDEQIIAIREGRIDFDDHLAGLAAVVREIAGNVGYVNDATWDAALRAGWSDTELADTFAYVLVNLCTNYFNHLVGTELDVPEAPAISAPRRSVAGATNN